MERLHRRRETLLPEAPRKASSPACEAGESAPRAEGVRVQWGAMSESLDLAGMTVGEARRLLRRPYNIAPEAQPLVNGDQTTLDRELAPGDFLEFVRFAGEKG